MNMRSIPSSSRTARALRGSDLIGKSVRNTQGNKAGQLKELIGDMASGKVRYAMLAFDPGIFVAEKLFTQPARGARAVRQPGSGC